MVLFITAALLLWIFESYESMESMVIEYWWTLLVVPFALRFYNWFTNLKQKAFDYGADTSGDQAERKAAQRDLKQQASKKQYAALAANPSYTKEEAARIRERVDHAGAAVQKSLLEQGPDYSIPLHRYVSGLPGPNLIRPSERKQQFTMATLADGQLLFHESSGKDQEGKVDPKKKFAQIPLASILKLEVVDLAAGREMRRVGADVGRKVAQTLVSAASQTGGARVGTSNVDAAKLIIHYVNEDGVVMPATFVFNSNSKLGTKAMEHLRLLNRTLGNYSFLGQMQWKSESGVGADIASANADGVVGDSEDFDLSEATALLGDMTTVLKWANMLSPHDSAVLTAKLSAEMIAGPLQDSGVQLVETKD